MINKLPCVLNIKSYPIAHRSFRFVFCKQILIYTFNRICVPLKHSPAIVVTPQPPKISLEITTRGRDDGLIEVPVFEIQQIAHLLNFQRFFYHYVEPFYPCTHLRICPYSRGGANG